MLFVSLHDFLVWLKNGSNQVDNNRVRSHTGKMYTHIHINRRRKICGDFPRIETEPQTYFGSLATLSLGCHERGILYLKMT